MCMKCKEFFKTKLHLQNHAQECLTNAEYSDDQFLRDKVYFEILSS